MEIFTLGGYALARITELGSGHALIGGLHLGGFNSEVYTHWSLASGSSEADLGYGRFIFKFDTLGGLHFWAPIVSGNQF